MTKKILIFIGLKIAEIGGMCGILYGWYWLGYVVCVSFGNTYKGGEKIAGGMLLSLLGLIVIFWAGFGIYHAIKANWRWAERLSNK